MLDVVGGFSVALGFALWRPSVWLLPFCAAICLACFGLWGIAEREIREAVHATGRLGVVRALGVLRGLAIATGIIAAFVAGFSVLAVLLGRWIRLNR